MSTQSQPPHNEELLGLLREVEGLKDGVLFKRVASGRGLAPWPGPLSKHATSVSNLEKHLLAAHREELGRLLTDACLRLLMEDPKIGGMVIPHLVDGKPILPMKPGKWRERCVGTRRACPGPPELEGPLDLLNRLMAFGGVAPSLLDVAQAGLSVAPTDALKAYRAHGLWLNGDAAGAQRDFLEIHGTALSQANRAIAGLSLARIAHAQGDLPGTVKWHVDAASGNEPNLLSVVGCLFFALQTGDKHVSKRAAEILANQSEGISTLVDIFCSRKRAGLLANSWQPTDSALKIRFHTHDDQVEKVLNLFR